MKICNIFYDKIISKNDYKKIDKPKMHSDYNSILQSFMYNFKKIV